jgi:diguanylate cyclase (GGDEF)-like protein
MSVEEQYSKIADELAGLPSDQLLKKIAELAVQLSNAVADFDNRMDLFMKHTEHIRDILTASNKMRRLYSAGEVNKAEKQKLDMLKAINKFNKEIPAQYQNLKVIRQEKDVVLTLEKDIRADVVELKEETAKEMGVLRRDVLKFYEPAKEKVSQHLKDQESAIMLEAQLMATIRKLVGLVAYLEPLTERFAYLMNRQREEMAKLSAAEPGKTIDVQQIRNAEKALTEVHQEVLLRLREEKTQVHDPFLALIKQERTGIEEVMRLLESKKGGLFRRSRKITARDIQKTIIKFTNIDEYHTFFSALRTHPELLDKGVAERLDGLMRKSKIEWEKIQKNAYTDALTDLGNKASYNKYLHNLVRKKSEFSMIVIDIDFFKKFNDTYGHSVGDRVLAEVARAIKDSTRSSDGLFRYGGEEMIVVFPRTDMATAFSVCQRLRKSVESLDLGTANGEKIRQVTISGGLIHVSAQILNRYGHTAFNPEKIAEEIFQKADSELYRAKQEGRNRVYKTEFQASA